MTAVVRCAVLALALAITWCAGVVLVHPEPTAAAVTGVPRPEHTVVVMLENEDDDSVLGSARAPYLNALAAQGAVMTQSFAITHPSQPNYLALFSGSTQGVTTDDCPVSFPGRDNLGAQLIRQGLSFVGYSESMPEAGYPGCASDDGLYRRKHSPWVDFPDLPASTNQTFDAFPTDFTRLPTVAFVTPDMCSDMHDCPVSTGDDWLRDHLDAYARWAQTHNSLLVVTFDEDGGSEQNQIPTILLGQAVRPGTDLETITHYNLLRTLEDAYGLPALGIAATVVPVRSAWRAASVAPPAVGLVNGTFEDRLAGWTRSGSTGSSSTSRHGGTRDARAGGVAGDSSLSQTFVVPGDKKSLSVSWLARCHDTRSHAWATITLEHRTSARWSTMLSPTCVKKGRWKKVTTKVTPGHTYRLVLLSHDDARPGTTNTTYFDDVSLR